jgi:hypothetical protein
VDHEVKIKANTGLCLDVKNANPNNGTPVQLYGCYGGAAQQWHYDRLHQTVVNTAYNKCLDVRGIDLTPGAPVQIWDCLGNDGQRWTYSPEDGGLRNALNNALTVDFNYIVQEEQLQSSPFMGYSSQQWYASQPARCIVCP